MVELIRLDGPCEPESSTPAADRLLQGNPQQRTWNFFTDPTGQFFAGRWSSSRGKWKIRYTEDELCCITEGRVCLTAESGRSWTFGVGDSFVVPAGFSGSWEVIEDCTKLYAIFQGKRD